MSLSFPALVETSERDGQSAISIFQLTCVGGRFKVLSCVRRIGGDYHVDLIKNDHKLDEE